MVLNNGMNHSLLDGSSFLVVPYCCLLDLIQSSVGAGAAGGGNPPELLITSQNLTARPQTVTDRS